MQRIFRVFSLSILIAVFSAGFLSAAGKGPVTIKPPVKTVPPVQPLPAAGKKTALPDLVVTQIKLDNKNHIILGIKNLGPGSISDEFFNLSSVRVEYGTKSEDFLLNNTLPGKPAVDPAQRLKNPGVSILFDTGLILDRAAEVLVSADANQKIAEADESRASNSKKAFLSPQPSGTLKPKAPLPAGPQTTLTPAPAAQAPPGEVRKMTPPAPDPDFGAPFTVEAINIVDVTPGSLIPPEKLDRTFQMRLRLKSTSTVPNRGFISAKWYVQLRSEAQESRPLTLSKNLQISLMPGQKDYFLSFQPRNIPDLGFSPRFVDLRYTLIDIQSPPPGPTPPAGSQNTPPPPPDAPGTTVSVPAAQVPNSQIAQEMARLDNASWGERQNVFKISLAVPQLNFVLPDPGARQARMTVKGSNFGRQRNDVKLALQKPGSSAFIEPQIYSWKEDSVEFKAPDANGIFSVAVYDRLFQTGSNKVSFSIADYADVPAYPSLFLTYVDLRGESGGVMNRLILAPLTPPDDNLSLSAVFPAAINHGWTRLIATTAARSDKWCYEYSRGYFIEVNGKLGLGDCSHFADPGWTQIEVPRAELGYDIKANYGMTFFGHSIEKKFMSSGFSVQIPYNGYVNPEIYLQDTVNHQRWTTVHLSDGKFAGHLSILIKIKVVNHQIKVDDVTCAISGDMDYLPELNAAWSETKGPLVQYLSAQLKNRGKALEDALTEKITDALGPLKALHKLEFTADNKIRVYYSDVSVNVTPQTATPAGATPAPVPGN